ncbi:hypothetical protein BA171_01530 [Candidatus Hamiltonella defensa (Bemisia tabaci)]|uniref:Uncharacterized protein n=1 Tax=Candidatus Hamiltonella defensa (Bemisia tabaci) TaxID=672795 RepID=A0A249DWD7_9ENTR|nr:hypothetical protein BA171_01530 [Candidatus Hamiltonella defensa (Bemisia tabaci)]
MRMALDDEMVTESRKVFHHAFPLKLAIHRAQLGLDDRRRDDGLTGTKAGAVVSEFVSSILGGDDRFESPEDRRTGVQGFAVEITVIRHPLGILFIGGELFGWP